ncbi:UPF0561 protein C2orf68 homolog [Acipenser ruthenus]|uniref:UPF0561 protein C2orf68 homolog n=1 Tax=Acipenser ruthenus TaxID=7906 RepID=UPI0027427569|nr:UPF0561 protein C2orf68 homolog [Acipenser ruthenus]
MSNYLVLIVTLGNLFVGQSYSYTILFIQFNVIDWGRFDEVYKLGRSKVILIQILEMEVLREEEAAMGPEFDHQTKFKPRGRLDMKHGFLHHIRRNQIARDDYDKEVKQAKEKQKKRHTTTAMPTRPRRPDLQVYHPRRRSGPETSPGLENEDSNESSSSTDPDQQGTELFCLEYEADSGEVTSVIVHKDDAPDKVVEMVAAGNSLDSVMKAALRTRIQEEMDKRRAKR